MKDARSSSGSSFRNMHPWSGHGASHNRLGPGIATLPFLGGSSHERALPCEDVSPRRSPSSLPELQDEAEQQNDGQEHSPRHRRDKYILGLENGVNRWVPRHLLPISCHHLHMSWGQDIFVSPHHGGRARSWRSNQVLKPPC